MRKAAKGSSGPTVPGRQVAVCFRVNTHDYHSLFTSLSQAIEILDRNRTPDPDFIAAYDTLKQSRAMLQRALNNAHEGAGLQEQHLAAA